MLAVNLRYYGWTDGRAEKILGLDLFRAVNCVAKIEKEEYSFGGLARKIRYYLLESGRE